MEPSKMWLQSGILIFACSADNNKTNENIGRGGARYFVIPGSSLQVIRNSSWVLASPYLEVQSRDLGVFSGKQAFREELGNISAGEMKQFILQDL